jgi:hypothetical protein
MNVSDWLGFISKNAGVTEQPNRRRYVKRIIENWEKVYYFKLNCKITDETKEELYRFVLEQRKDREFYFYHDHSRRRWYFSDNKIAVAVKLKYGGEISCSVRK